MEKPVQKEFNFFHDGKQQRYIERRVKHFGRYAIVSCCAALVFSSGMHLAAYQQSHEPVEVHVKTVYLNQEATAKSDTAQIMANIAEMNLKQAKLNAQQQKIDEKIKAYNAKTQPSEESLNELNKKQIAYTVQVLKHLADEQINAQKELYNKQMKQTQ